MLIINSPLEQFEVFPILALTLHVNNDLIDVSLTNFVLFLFFDFSFVLGLLLLGTAKLSLIPTRLEILLGQISNFVVDTIRQQTGDEGLKFFVFYFLIFFFILISNLLGLIPFCFTTTSHLIMVSFIALTCNLAFVLIGFFKHGFSFLNYFIPSSAPKPLIPLITLIELVSYLLRTFSLSIRLFANMMAGHILLYILASFVLRLASANLFFVALIPVLLMVAVFALELGICFIQAYVFLVLLSIYLSDSLATPGH
jgi:F-type H+-transporting ATPase subunit a